MLEYVLIPALLLALLTGWWLNAVFNRFLPRGSAQTPILAKHFFKNINQLFREQPDKAINGFIAAVPVNGDTLETHLALGNLMRQRGELGRAIRLHQNLTIGESLDAGQKRQVQMELAKDCLKAGLLDRAERLFLELAEEDDDCRIKSINYLVKIYRDEKEWEKAIHISTMGDPNDQEQSRQRAHFYCELSEAAIAQGDLDEARHQLRQAFKQYGNSARARILLGSLEESCGNFPLAIENYRLVGDDCPVHIPEVVEALQRCCAQTGRKEDLLALFKHWMELYPGVTLLLGILALLQELEGQKQSLAYLSRQLKIHPSLRGLHTLLILHQEMGIAIGLQELSALSGLLGTLISHRPSHRCIQCGFRGQQLHWLCPKCKQWGSVQPIKGVEGE